MASQVIEGTWEEIKRHEAELAGRHVRVTIKSDRSTMRKPRAPLKTTTAAKELRGRGMFAGILSTEDYFREKREDTAREDRSL